MPLDEGEILCDWCIDMFRDTQHFGEDALLPYEDVEGDEEEDEEGDEEEGEGGDEKEGGAGGQEGDNKSR